MVEAKNGACKITGSENEIFADVVQAVSWFCTGFAEVKGFEVTALLYCVVAAAADRIDGVDMTSLANALKER